MNSRKPPQDDKYKVATIIDNIWNVVFFVSIVPTLIQKICTGSKDTLFLIINALLLIILSILEHLRGKNINEATIIRRRNLFDATFELNRIYNRVDEFYDNQDIDDKMIRLFANSHESMFFTKEISSRMLIRQYIMIGIISTLFLVSIFDSGITEFNSISMGLLLSYFGIGRILDIKSVHEDSNKLFEESLRIANDMELGVKESNIAEILEIIINYESILSSMNFVLSDRIYNKKRIELTESWLEIKGRYGTYNKNDESSLE